MIAPERTLADGQVYQYPDWADAERQEGAEGTELFFDKWAQRYRAQRSRPAIALAFNASLSSAAIWPSYSTFGDVADYYFPPWCKGGKLVAGVWLRMSGTAQTDPGDPWMNGLFRLNFDNGAHYSTVAQLLFKCDWQAEFDPGPPPVTTYDCIGAAMGADAPSDGTAEGVWYLKQVSFDVPDALLDTVKEVRFELSRNDATAVSTVDASSEPASLGTPNPVDGPRRPAWYWLEEA
jgi:hypothetical protein